MFESVKQGNQQNPMMYFASLLISFVIHAAVICVLVILPMVFFNVLEADDLVAILIAPPSPPVPPPLPSPPAKAGTAPRQVTTHTSMDAPPSIPHGVPPPDETSTTIGVDQIVQDIRSYGPGQGTGNESGRSVLPPMEPPKLPPLPPPPTKKRTVIIPGGNVQESKLILKVPPVYPELARKAHVEGTVVIEAIIDEEGNVTGIKVVSGHPFLTRAAEEAVRQWKYSPTVLNGEPVSVLATVTVIFHLR